MKKKFLFAIIGLLFVVAALNCGNSGGDLAGTITETQNTGLLRGRVTNADGSPAVNVKVRFVAADHDPGVGTTVSLDAKDSCITDANGFYGTDALESGSWNILASNTATQEKLFVDSVVFAGESLVVDDAALAVTGAVRGSVKVQAGDDPRTVSVYVIGALAYSMVETDGGFVFSSMAKGRYRLRFRAFDPKYEVLDTVVDVVSGVDKLIDSPVELPLRIPTPTGLQLNYDTLKQVVTLQWDAMNPSKVGGYNIYRQQVDSAERKLNAVPFMGGVVYVDSTAVQDLRYVYRVASVDSLGNEGSFKAVWKDTVTIKPAFDLVATFGGQGTGNGKFSEISEIKLIDNNRILVLDRGANKVQVFDTTGNFITSWGSYGNSDGQFNVPIAATFDDSGYVYILEMLGAGRIQKFDSEGKFLASWVIGAYHKGVVYGSRKLFVVGADYSGVKVLDLGSNELVLKPLHNEVTVHKIAYQSVNHTIWLTNHTENKIFMIDTNANEIGAWGATGFTNGKFNYISSLELADSCVLVTDKDNGRIQILSMSGGVVAKLCIPDYNVNNINNTPELKPVYAVMTKNKRTLYYATSIGISKFSIKPLSF